MQNNYLLIGLGGTGCAVVRELKKRLYLESSSRGNTEVPEVYTFEEGTGEKIQTRIATLSIDSNANDLSGKGESNKWRVFGKTLKLEDKEKVLLNPVGIGDVLANIQRYPGITPWIKGDMDFVNDITRGTSEPAGCNQIRLMGRLALANGQNIANVKGAVADRLKALSSGRQYGAEIHIACSLAAGTGSGIVVDVIAQIQKDLRNQPGNFRIYVHGFVTDKEVGDIDTGNFYANQYAALTELNAFHLANYQPWDITSIDEPRRLSVPCAGDFGSEYIAGTYKSVALITDTTEGGATVPLSDQIENVAEFIFQLSVRQMGNLPYELRYALTTQDHSQYPADEIGGDRSTAFISYGVNRVAIPENEIREKLVYSFSRQFVLRVLYNHWDELYTDTPRRFVKDGFVDKRRGLWGISRDHLSLNLVEEINGQPVFYMYKTDWSERLTHLMNRVQDNGDDFNSRISWLKDFDRGTEEFWNKGFRSRGYSGGVEDYFRVRHEASEMTQRASEMRSIVERDLLKGVEDLDSEYVLHHLPDAIDFLIERIKADRVYFGKRSTEVDDLIKEADRQRELIRIEYLQVGRFRLANKHIRLLNTYRQSTIDYYYGRTIRLAYDYGQEFCLVLINQLQSLHRDVDQFSANLKKLSASLKVEVDARITDVSQDNNRDEVEYRVDANFVNETIRTRFVNDEEVQEQHVTEAMQAFKELRGDRLEFLAYTEKMPGDEGAQSVDRSLVDELYRICEKNAYKAHQKLVQNDKSFKGIFEQNIVEKLYNDYDGHVEGELEAWLRQLIDRSMPMASFSANERMASNIASGPVLTRCVFIPKCQSVPEEFQQALHEKIQNINHNKGRFSQAETGVYSVPEDLNPSEVVVMSVAFFFSARIAKVTHGLYEKYQQRLADFKPKSREKNRGYVEVHTESHNPELPSLMKSLMNK